MNKDVVRLSVRVLALLVSFSVFAFGGTIYLYTQEAGWTVSWNVTDCVHCAVNPGVDQPVAEVLDPTAVDPIPGWGYPKWADNSSNSKWISPLVAGAQAILTPTGIYMAGKEFGFGVFEYTYAFDLGQYLAGSGSFGGKVWADGRLAAFDSLGASIRVNGVDLPASVVGSPGPPDSYFTGSNFLISDSLITGLFGAQNGPQGVFQPGANTITFRVSNQGKPTGLRVEALGTYQEIPEPATWLLAGFGLTAVALLRRRRG